MARMNEWMNEWIHDKEAETLCLVLKVCPAPRTQALRRRRHWPIAASLITGQSVSTRWSGAFEVVPAFTLAILDGKLSPAVHSWCYSRLGSDQVNSAGTVLEEWSQAHLAPESDDDSRLMRQCTVLLKDKTPPWDIRNMSGSSFLARRLSQ